jgi:uncharacterized protein (UPF0335 family)
MIPKGKLQAFYNDVLAQEDRKKDISADIKDAFNEFAKGCGISVKSLKRDFRNYKDYMKNKDEFLEVDLEADSLTQTWLTEYQEKGNENIEPVEGTE